MKLDTREMNRFTVLNYPVISLDTLNFCSWCTFLKWFTI